MINAQDIAMSAMLTSLMPVFSITELSWLAAIFLITLITCTTVRSHWPKEYRFWINGKEYLFKE